jgi:hypothetical protein
MKIFRTFLLKMLQFENRTNEIIILSFWWGIKMVDIYIEPGDIFNIDDCTTREWIMYKSFVYKRIGKFWELPAVNNLTSHLDDCNFKITLKTHVWILENA